jgi:chemotaxis protein methyltransferase CheR
MNENDDSFLIKIDPHEYQLITKLVNERYGVNLTEKKLTLVRGRLNKLIRQKGFQKFSEYLSYLQNDESGYAMIELMDRLTTNHTYFYREPHTFDFFQRVTLPPLINRLDAGEEIRLWSAGCSSGEEPYTLAMVMSENVPAELLNKVKILATDLSLQVLEHAIHGFYSAERLKNVPNEWLKKYFKPIDLEKFQVNEKLQSLITFKRLNLVHHPFPFRRKFAAIFCRNVMIYFDQDNKNALIKEFHRVLEHEGWLFIGHSESLGREQKFFRFVEPSIYQRFSD